MLRFAIVYHSKESAKHTYEVRIERVTEGVSTHVYRIVFQNGKPDLARLWINVRNLLKMLNPLQRVGEVQALLPVAGRLPGRAGQAARRGSASSGEEFLFPV